MSGRESYAKVFDAVSGVGLSRGFSGCSMTIVALLICVDGMVWHWIA